MGGKKILLEGTVLSSLTVMSAVSGPLYRGEREGKRCGEFRAGLLRLPKPPCCPWDQPELLVVWVFSWVGALA